jgi:hypothetical protein
MPVTAGRVIHQESGMTLRGDKCQLQPDIASALLDGAHKRGINTEYVHRNGVKRALVFLRKGAAPRRYGAP